MTISRTQNTSLYISIPFCQHLCSYCDLNAYAGLNHLMPAYTAALVKEIRQVGQGAIDDVHTLYFGGGTPSILPLESLAEIFAALRDSFSLTGDCEISLEANPDSVDAACLNGLRTLGVNRLSFGAQSAQANELALFGRTHTFEHVAEAMRLARQADFENISLDLIYGAPGQTMASWRDTLQKSIALNPDHFSIYALSLDFGTPLRAWVQRGLLSEPDSDLAADMYEWADEELERAGFEQYEISSWAKAVNSGQLSVNSGLPTVHCSLITDYKCRHNLQYWRNLPYLGLGAGAHGCFDGYRYSNVASPTAYVRRMEEGAPKPFPFSPSLAESIPIDARTEMDETMLTGLRLTQDGVGWETFQQRFGMKIEDVYAKEIGEMKERGLVEADTDRVKLTKGGRLVANWVFEKFV
ncbi:MAG: radical SAM family heme chaperone HemW [Chloroflexi bacterium]|nr:radical SAM family heme chaperone HemW [Chloroflexota bacterium]